MRSRVTILAKLLLAYVVPTLLLFTLFAVVAYEVARRDLEEELGKRLSAVAASAATQVRGKYLVDLQAGDEDDRGYQNARRKLLAVQRATGVDRIYMFDDELTSRCDTAEGFPIGSTYHQLALDRHELSRVFGDGSPMSSVLFEGLDGKLYKAGYAPVRAGDEDDDEIVLAVGVDAPATYFTRLAELRRTLILYGALLAIVVLGISIVVATLITHPLRQLATAAERIGRGELDAPVDRASHDEIGLLAVTMDEMRRGLRDRDAHMQLMLSGIAHEVRNPLGGIELYAGILRDEIEDGDERRSHVARIDKELAYLKAVVNEFLDYARRPAPELGVVDLLDLARDVADVEQGDAVAAGVEVVVTGDAMTCAGDATQLRRALLNLVRNAIQAAGGPEGGRRVTVDIRERDDRAVLTVTNEGAHIPDDVRERLFEPFFTTREKGTGLGLAFVREIVRDHKGTIEVRSTRPAPEGRATTSFTLELPLAPAQESPS